METQVDRIIKHIETVAQCNKTPGNGCTRFSYSEEDRAAKAYIAEQFASIGMVWRTDSVGNMKFYRDSDSHKESVVIIGSHLDTVANGGKFDGVVGVVGGLEIAQRLYEESIDLPFRVEVMIFAEEEGSNFGSTMLGSKALMGIFNDPNVFESYMDANGHTWLEKMAAFGLKPELMKFDLIDPLEVLAMFELHIEQGVILEREKKQIGIVENIAGMMSCEITIGGHSNHAGSTPMHMRNDPLPGAAEIILGIEHTARTEIGPHTVATVGKISAKPGGSNVIPESVTFSLDIRDIVDANIQAAMASIKQKIRLVTEKRGLSATFHMVGKSKAVPLSPFVVSQITGQAEEMGTASMKMNSGAVHDAAMIAEKCKVGMIFVPSRDGLSHTPNEFTDYHDIALGCDVLLNTILAMKTLETGGQK